MTTDKPQATPHENPPVVPELATSREVRAFSAVMSALQGLDEDRAEAVLRAAAVLLGVDLET